MRSNKKEMTSIIHINEPVYENKMKKKAPGIPVLIPRTPATFKSPKLDMLTPKTRKVPVPHSCISQGKIVIKKNSSHNLPKKSVSLQELNFTSNIPSAKKWQSKEHGDEAKMESILPEGPFSDLSTIRESDLARQASKIFMLHAWRQSRAKIAKFKIQVQKLENEVENLNIQNVVLRNLFESEKVRVAVAISDSSHLKNRLEQETKTVIEMKNNLSKLESERISWEHLSNKQNLEISSLKEELSCAVDKINTLQNDCNGFIMELSRSKKKELQLVSKLETADAMAQKKVNSLEYSMRECANFKTKIAELTSKNGELLAEMVAKDNKIMKYKNDISKLNVELRDLQTTRIIQKQYFDKLEEDVALAKEEIKGQEEVINHLKGTVLQYETEKIDSDNMIHQLKNHVVFGGVRLVAWLFLPSSN